MAASIAHESRWRCSNAPGASRAASSSAWAARPSTQALAVRAKVAVTSTSSTSTKPADSSSLRWLVRDATFRGPTSYARRRAASSSPGVTKIVV